MKAILFAMAVAALALAAVSGTSQATPLAPLPAAASTDAGSITPIYYYTRTTIGIARGTTAIGAVGDDGNVLTQAKRK